MLTYILFRPWLSIMMDENKPFACDIVINHLRQNLQ